MGLFKVTLTDEKVITSYMGSRPDESPIGNAWYGILQCLRLGTLEEISEVSGLQLEEVKEMAEKLSFDERGRVIGGNYKIAEFASDLIRRRRFTLEDIAVLLELPLEEVKELAASIEMNETTE